MTTRDLPGHCFLNAFLCNSAHAGHDKNFPPMLFAIGLALLQPRYF